MEQEQPNKPEQEVCEPVSKSVVQDRKIGKAGAWAVAAIATAFLSFQCWSAEKRGEDVEPMLYLSCFGVITTALGVNIKPEELTELVKGKFLAGK